MGGIRCLKLRAWLLWLAIILVFPFVLMTFFIVLPIYIGSVQIAKRAKEANEKGIDYEKPKGAKMVLINIGLLILGIILMPFCMLLFVICIPCALVYLCSRIPSYLERKKKIKKSLEFQMRNNVIEVNKEAQIQ